MLDEDIATANKLGLAALTLITSNSDDLSVRMASCQFLVANMIINLGVDPDCWHRVLGILVGNVDPMLSEAMMMSGHRSETVQ